VAAGYVVYGPSTMLVYADDTSVDGFTLDRSVGEFFLTHPGIRIPAGGHSYAVNEANFDRWTREQQRLVEMLRHGEAPGERTTARYVGSLVADFHRTLLKGGLYMYPGEIERPGQAAPALRGRSARVRGRARRRRASDGKARIMRSCRRRSTSERPCSRQWGPRGVRRSVLGGEFPPPEPTHRGCTRGPRGVMISCLSFDGGAHANPRRLVRPVCPVPDGFREPIILPHATARWTGHQRRERES
jgi:hypothetical protein